MLNEKNRFLIKTSTLGVFFNLGTLGNLVHFRHYFLHLTPVFRLLYFCLFPFASFAPLRLETSLNLFFSFSSCPSWFQKRAVSLFFMKGGSSWQNHTYDTAAAKNTNWPPAIPSRSPSNPKKRSKQNSLNCTPQVH